MFLNLPFLTCPKQAFSRFWQQTLVTFQPQSAPNIFEMFSFYFNQGTLPSCSRIFGYFGLSSNRFVCDKMFMRIITVPQSPGAQPLSRAHTIFNLRSFIHSRSPLSNANFRNLQNRRQTCLTSRGKYVLVWRISGLFQKVQVT